ncbi:hypothetical protein [Candidatus Chlamydia sanziniae]|uniref:Uncharacterized protein n=1 Tax=Candidatus Chlamydia sanziniae TaxID=1806891 RepID=A0A1A9HTA5_9CHLA|nr:hypothetical protein [Candidatus Chlamydia sanziniae]ANH78218.1 hypothetical protein Cs308_0042 [Candidatus Chlamydia sanziniae]
MAQCDSIDSVQEILILEQSLETLGSLDIALATYEKMFSLIYQSLNRALRKDQQCYLLSVQPDGGLVKDALGSPVVQIFSMNFE